MRGKTGSLEEAGGVRGKTGSLVRMGCSRE